MTWTISTTISLTAARAAARAASARARARARAVSARASARAAAAAAAAGAAAGAATSTEEHRRASAGRESGPCERGVIAVDVAVRVPSRMCANRASRWRLQPAATNARCVR
eukprot:7179005-Prymnesium_polylepis.1